MDGKRGHFRRVSFTEREDRGFARTRGRRRAFGDHLRENRALHLARAIGNRPRLALDDPEFALFGDERGECRLPPGAGVGGDAEYATAASAPQRPPVPPREQRPPPGPHPPKRT